MFLRRFLSLIFALLPNNKSIKGVSTLAKDSPMLKLAFLCGVKIYHVLNKIY
jgi:hypothetical protein